MQTGDLASRNRMIGLPGVSRETLSHLDDYVSELTLWQKKINLVSPATLNEVWERHILDCAQLMQHRREARIWVDIGSGAGLPGIILACLLKGLDDGSHIHLVESNRKKTAFLHHMIGRHDLPATVHSVRIEDALSNLGPVDIVTARALASLEDLLRYSNQLLKKGAVGLFLKGRDVENELTRASKHWQFNYQLLPSITDPTSSIIRLALQDEVR